MNYLLHRQKYPKSQVTLPDGLQALMGDICREVLRAQPPSDQLYPFIANYLEALSETRDKIQITTTTLSDIISKATNIVDLLQMEGITLEKANEAVNIMKKNFYQLFNEKREEHFNETTIREFKEAEVIAELVKKCEFTKNQIFSLKPIIQEAFKNFIDEYFRALRGMTLNMEVVNPILKFTLEKYFQDIPSASVMIEAATTIQSVYRGYRIRKSLKKYKDRSRNRMSKFNDYELKKFEKELKELSSDEFNKLGKAATVIQRAFRNNLRESGNSSKPKISIECLKEVVNQKIHYDDFDLNTDYVPEAMNVLSKGYKDYKQRMETDTNNEGYKEEFENIDRMVEQAVKVIQKAYRQYNMKRKRMQSGTEFSSYDNGNNFSDMETHFEKLYNVLDNGK